MDKKDRVVKISGKDYVIVPARVVDFREKDVYKGWALETEIVDRDRDSVIVRAVVKDCDGIIRSTGHGQKSTVEFAETKSIGRALGLLDRDLMGTAIASAEEMAEFVERQENENLVEYNALVRTHWHTVAEVKNLLHPQWGELENQPNVTDARALLKDLGDDTYRALWKAPTKGGIFTTVERTLLKEPEKAESIVGAAAL